MTEIRIIHTGEFKEKYYADAAAEYAKRLGAFCSFRYIPIKEEKTDEARAGEAVISRALELEGERILAATGKNSFKIALCIEGKKISSEQLAELIEEKSRNYPIISFIIGSSHGLSETVKAGCGLRLSMSDMTLPHSLARVVLTEQIYRAYTISKGMKYHK